MFRVMNHWICPQEESETRANLCEKLILFFRLNIITKNQLGRLMDTEEKQDLVTLKCTVWIGLEQLQEKWLRI